MQTVRAGIVDVLRAGSLRKIPGADDVIMRPCRRGVRGDVEILVRRQNPRTQPGPVDLAIEMPAGGLPIPGRCHRDRSEDQRRARRCKGARTGGFPALETLKRGFG